MKNKLLILGGTGMVGSSIIRNIKNYKTFHPTSKQVDLCNQKQTFDYINKIKPDKVVIAAAKVGGIYANNKYPAEFIYQNLTIATNSIEGSFQAGVKKLIFLGSSCIYPKYANQPIQESELLTGCLEPTNEAYAVAKIAGLKLCEFYSKQYGVDYHSLMPCNLYGIGDNYHPENSHVIPGLIRKIHKAKLDNLPEIKIWGSGKIKREFLNVDDLSKAILLLLESETHNNLLNVGYGEDISIMELTKLISNVIGYNGIIKTDTSKPDGPPKKLMNISEISKMGWSPTIPLREGLEITYNNIIPNLVYS